MKVRHTFECLFSVQTVMLLKVVTLTIDKTLTIFSSQYSNIEMDVGSWADLREIIACSHNSVYHLNIYKTDAILKHMNLKHKMYYYSCIQ